MKTLLILTSIILLTLRPLQAQTWGAAISGAGNDYSSAILADEFGNSYIAGWFDSEELKFNNNIKLTRIGKTDSYVAKFDKSGLCVWARIISGNDNNYANSICLDNSGNLFVVGEFYSDTLKFNSVDKLANTGGADSFIAKYDSLGNFVWAQQIKGESDEIIKSIAVNSIGEILIAGNFNGAQLELTPSITFSKRGFDDSFIAKFSNDGNCLWGRQIASSGFDDISKIIADKSGNIIISGNYYNNEIMFGSSATLSNSGKNDGYIAKFGTNGEYLWASRIGGDDEDYINSIAADSSGNIVCVGNYSTKNLFMNDSVRLDNFGSFDAFVAKFDENGKCAWATNITGVSHEDATSVCIDKSGNIFIVGYFNSSKANINKSIQISNSGGFDGFLLELDRNGNYLYSNSMNGELDDFASEISLDAENYIFVCGNFKSKNFLLKSYCKISSIRNFDSFIARYNSLLVKSPILLYPENNSSNLKSPYKFYWNKIKDENSYLVEISHDSTFRKILFSQSTLDTILTASINLPSNNKFFWRVRAAYNDEISLWSDYNSFTNHKSPSGIAPSCFWARKIASLNSVQIIKSKIDKHGNIFVCGYYNADISFNNIKLIHSNNFDSFIAKFDSDGKCLWATPLYGKSNEYAKDFTFDSLGNVYLTGFYGGYEILIQNNKHVLASDGYLNSFLTKLDSNGLFVWAKRIKSSGYNEASSIIIDKNINIYIVGVFSTHELVFDNSIILTNDYGISNFIAKYNPNGVLQWAKQYGGYGMIYPKDIIIDSNDDLIIMGNFENTYVNFEYNTIHGKGGWDCFLAKYKNNGSFIKAISFGGQQNDICNDMNIDTNNNIYICGYSTSDMLKFNDNNTLYKFSGSEGFIAKFDTDYNCLWAQGIYGYDNDYVSGCAIDKMNNIYVSGYYSSGSVAFNNDIGIESKGANDAFIAKYNPNGSCIWAQNIGGAKNEKASGIFLDDVGSIYTYGTYESDNLDFNNNITLANDSSRQFGYLAKYNSTINKIEEPFLAEDGIIIRPNPASEYIEIGLVSTDAQINAIYLYNEIGILVESYSINQINSEPRYTKFNVSNLPQGAYRAVVKCDNKTYSKAVIIIK